jgi:hypothetical protein
VAILNGSFSGSVRVIVRKTVAELCQQIILLLPQVTRFTDATKGDYGKPTGSELTSNGMAIATGTETDGLTGGNNSQIRHSPSGRHGSEYLEYPMETALIAKCQVS